MILMKKFKTYVLIKEIRKKKFKAFLKHIRFRKFNFKKKLIYF